MEDPRTNPTSPDFENPLDPPMGLYLAEVVYHVPAGAALCRTGQRIDATPVRWEFEALPMRGDYRLHVYFNTEGDPRTPIGRRRQPPPEEPPCDSSS